MTTAAPRPGTGRDDWLDEGLRLVASLGAPALTLDRICERMALTKGAFYHHFGSVPKFRIALLDWYEQACITVGALLIAAAYGVLAVAGTAQRFGPEGMYRLGVWALAALLLARGVAGPLFSRRGDREFRFWNLAAYSPLCLALGPGALIAHR